MYVNQLPKHFQVFGKEWFLKNQKLLRDFANSNYGRDVLYINGNKSSVGNRKIDLILPNSITWADKNWAGKPLQFNTEFRTHSKFSKRLYYEGKPIWNLFHKFDMQIANRFAPQFNLGFDTLTTYPGATGTDDPIDGTMSTNGNASWTVVRDQTSANSVSKGSSLTGSALYVQTAFAGALYYDRRSGMAFLTSVITAAGVISAVVISLAGTGDAVINGDTDTLNITSWTPAATNNLVVGDYNIANFGTSAYASKLFSAWNSTDGTYNDFTLDAAGIAYINKTGVSPFGVRDQRDLANSAPTGNNELRAYMSGKTGTSADEKLVATYTLPTGSNFFQFFRP